MTTKQPTDALDTANAAKHLASDVAYELLGKSKALRVVGLTALADDLLLLSRMSRRAAELMDESAKGFIGTEFQRAQESSANLLSLAIGLSEKNKNNQPPTETKRQTDDDQAH